MIKEDGSKENLTEKEGLVDFNGYYALHGLKKNEITNTYNFVDVDKGIDEEIEEYSRVTVSYRASYLDYYQFDDYITGSDRYYMSMFYSTDVREDGLLCINYKEQLAVIIDTETGQMYYMEYNKGNEEQCIACLYYDNNTEKIMAISYLGKVKEVKLQDGSIILEDKNEINLNGYEISNNGYQCLGGLSGNRISKEYMILTRMN